MTIGFAAMAQPIMTYGPFLYALLLCGLFWLWLKPGIDLFLAFLSLFLLRANATMISLEGEIPGYSYSMTIFLRVLTVLTAGFLLLCLASFAAGYRQDVKSRRFNGGRT